MFSGSHFEICPIFHPSLNSLDTAIPVQYLGTYSGKWSAVPGRTAPFLTEIIAIQQEILGIMMMAIFRTCILSYSLSENARFQSVRKTLES